MIINITLTKTELDNLIREKFNMPETAKINLNIREGGVFTAFITKEFAKTHKIAAIKNYRAVTNHGLAESKCKIEEGEDVCLKTGNSEEELQKLLRELGITEGIIIKEVVPPLSDILNI